MNKNTMGSGILLFAWWASSVVASPSPFKGTLEQQLVHYLTEEGRERQTGSFSYLFQRFAQEGWWETAAFFGVQALQQLGVQSGLQKTTYFPMNWNFLEKVVKETGWGPWQFLFATEESIPRLLRGSPLRLQNHLRYEQAKNFLLKEQAPEKALKVLQGISSFSGWSAEEKGLFYSLRATVQALLFKNALALKDFDLCLQVLPKAHGVYDRCLVGKARVFYQKRSFLEADRQYGSLPRGSWLWPEILLERSWVAFVQKNWNRALGRLVSYDHPWLQFAFSPAVPLVKAQVYLELCLPSDVSTVVREWGRQNQIFKKDIQQWRSKQSPGESKDTEKIEQENGVFFETLFDWGKKNARERMPVGLSLKAALARVFRSPAFGLWLKREQQLRQELDKVKKWKQNTSVLSFFHQTLQERLHQVRQAGGKWLFSFVEEQRRNLQDHQEKISFVDLETTRQKRKSLKKKQATLSVLANRFRGGKPPPVGSEQLLWSFEGEFWEDEMGEYLFALESECEG